MRQQLREVAKTHAIAVETREQEKLQAENERKEKHSRKLKGHANRRQELGFNDNGAEEVEDEAADNYALDLARYEKQQQDKRDRKPIKMVTEVQGVSRKEYLDSMLKENDKFQDQ